jgi:aspartyl-tRNA(Asn)/glutamyl-tRNA(Gln) amidotransferase subunit C
MDIVRTTQGSHRPASWYDPRAMSTPFGREEVLRIAALAHIELTEDEITLFGRQITDILGYVEQVRAIDTTGVAPTSHVLDRAPLDRPDEARDGLPRRDALGNAPDPAREAGLFRVPRVIG